MKKLASALGLFGFAAVAGAQGLVPTGSNYFFYPNIYAHPIGLAIGDNQMFVAGQNISPTTGLIWGGMFPIYNSGLAISDQNAYEVADLVNNETPYGTANPNAPLDFRMVGNGFTSNGTKIQYFGGSGWLFTANGSLNYTYTADGNENDYALRLGKYPFGSYTAASLGNGSNSELGILYAEATGPNPVLEFTDPDISPTLGTPYTNKTLSAFAVTAPSNWNPAPSYLDNQFLIAGKDNLAGARGGSRVSSYKINSDASVSLVYSETFPNSISGGVFRYHDVRVAAYSGDFGVTADNQISYNAAKQYTYNYVLYAYDGSGNLLWQSAPHTGDVTNISIGTPANIYVLTSRDPKQSLCQYDSTQGNGSPTWTKPCDAAHICNAANQGVVYALNTADLSGYRHITVVKLDQNGNRVYAAHYSTQPTNNDIVSDLIWNGGQVYVTGQCVDTRGDEGLFGVQWKQVSLTGFTQWSGNGHWYKAVYVPGGITWTAAEAAAEQAGGTLATITSDAENTFVYNLVSDPKYWRFTNIYNCDGPWLGGTAPEPRATPLTGWAWVTGEPWTYSNWSSVQPDNAEGLENHLEFIGAPYTENPGPYWNDLDDNGTAIGGSPLGYVIEINPAT